MSSATDKDDQHWEYEQAALAIGEATSPPLWGDQTNEGEYVEHHGNLMVNGRVNEAEALGENEFEDGYEKLVVVPFESGCSPEDTTISSAQTSCWASAVPFRNCLVIYY